MSESKAFSSPSSFFTSSSSAGTGFTFCVGRDPGSSGNDHLGSKPVSRHRFVRFKKKFSAASEKGNKGDNSKTPPHQDEKTETTLPTDTNENKPPTPSAVTGEIPCHFEGSSYFSKLSSPICSTPEVSIKKEMHEKSERKPSPTHIVIVSRILSGIPQSPHFLPLKAYSNVSKQRLINAWDTIFKETVDKLLTLQVNGFLADAKRLWETMEELEKMGYNVLLLRRRLVELTDVLHRRRRHMNTIMRMKEKAEQHRMEKSRLEFQIQRLSAKVEAEEASEARVMAEVAKMEDEMPQYIAGFNKLATELL